MSIKRMFEMAPNADVLSALRHNQMQTEMAIRHHPGFAAAERA